MSKQTISAISIIPLLLGSILMLATGFGFISSKYSFVAGLACFVVFAFTESISGKIIGIKINQLWKSHKNIKQKLRKSSTAWNAPKISSATNQDSRTSLKHKSFETATWSSV
ncbi:MAG: hypothetical protein GY845_16675 [Planctomycetes bacterium]|nr:hypothetical protein [Planctomycetota bacterium]